MLLEELLSLLERKIKTDKYCGDVIASDVRDKQFMQDINNLFSATGVVRGSYNTNTFIAYFWDARVCTHDSIYKFLKTDKVGEINVSNDDLINFHITLASPANLATSKNDTTDENPLKVKIIGQKYYIFIQNTRRKLPEEKLAELRQEIADIF